MDSLKTNKCRSVCFGIFVYLIMKMKIGYWFIGLAVCFSLFGFSKVKKKDKIDKSVYKYECIYEVKLKTDTFRYSVKYNADKDSTLTLSHSFIEFGGPPGGFMVKCQFIKNNMTIDSTFVFPANRDCRLKHVFTKFLIIEDNDDKTYHIIPTDILKYDKHTFLIIDAYDSPASVTTYTYKCKKVCTTEQLEEIHKLSYPYTKKLMDIETAKKYRDTCDCKLENTTYKEL